MSITLVCKMAIVGSPTVFAYIHMGPFKVPSKDCRHGKKFKLSS